MHKCALCDLLTRTVHKKTQFLKIINFLLYIKDNRSFQHTQIDLKSSDYQYAHLLCNLGCFTLCKESSLSTLGNQATQVVRF